MTQKPDWFRIAVMTALAIALVWVLIVLGRSPVSFALGQAVPPEEVRLPAKVALQDRETYSMPLSATHQICWNDPNTPPATSIKIWRYRVEGGPRTLYLELLRSGWVPDVAPNTGFCHKGIKLPKAGHWIYDAALCWGTNCSIQVTASCGEAVDGCSGNVASVRRGWWIYGFLPAPTGPVVN